MSRSDDRFVYLDSLRAIAALAVVLQHAAEFSFLARDASGVGYWFFTEFFNFGRYGVAVFFLISGFLIPSSIRPGPHTMRSFVIGRFFRLYPLYWASLIFTIIAVALIRDQYFPLRMVLENFTMFQMLNGGMGRNVVPVYWSLFVEMLFYIICALLFLFGMLHQPKTPSRLVFCFALVMTATSLVLLVAPGSGEAAMMKIGTLAMYLMLMFLGQSLRFVSDGKLTSGWRDVALSCAAIVFYCLIRQATGRYEEEMAPPAILMGTLVAIATFLVARYLPFLRLPLLVWIGSISYGLYLFHHVVNVWVRSYIPYAETVPQAVVLIGSVIAGSAAISWLAYQAIEKPGISIGRRIRDIAVGKTRQAA